MSRAIVIFARAPEMETAAKGLPARFASLFHRITAEWLRAAALMDATPIIACAANARARFDAILPDISRLYIEQRGTTFGQRLASTSEAAFELGFDQVAITAIDAPLPTSDVFGPLAYARAVVVPACDGGINLIALRAPERQLLWAMAPRQRDVLQRCRAYFDSLIVLEVSSDIDSFTVDCWPLAEMPAEVVLPRHHRRHVTRPPPPA
jgi:glycosyltransferase A (GT-A) superfamily protein (DUF2064 family)